ncbi:MAG: hypothetical protein N2561_08685 [Bacteroidetes bacterium]|nr:hypothetical protein [Rhodothermia bacterium]MCS7155316.1 hypothetical protein [Bacteroidota bacterium]MCX7907591.1 hypothetical protein [Bacteroidota bacterium]MDW8138585.1 hypothetical protein [Bacteroidota bacterium]MDW8284478.1 hypothetical protein [Bacteroidota bacterium]
MRVWLSIVLSLLLGIPRSGAQTGPERWREPARAAGLDPELVVSLWTRATAQGWSAAPLEELIETSLALERQGAPGELLLQKALEGLAKQVPQEQVLRVIGSLERTVARTQEMFRQREAQWLERMPSLAEREARRQLMREITLSQMQGTGLEAIAQAMDRWVRLRRRPDWRDLAAAVRLLPEMPTPPVQAAELIAALLEAGGRTPELGQLPGALRMAQQQMRLPSEAIAQMATRHIRGGMPVPELLERMRRGTLDRRPLEGLGRPGRPRG